MTNNETVDLDGNIGFTRGEGVLVEFQEKDELGVVVDPETHPRYFNIPKVGYRELVPVSPDDSTQYRLILSLDVLQPISTSGVPFFLSDEQGDVPISLWAGVIRETSVY